MDIIITTYFKSSPGLTCPMLGSLSDTEKLPLYTDCTYAKITEVTSWTFSDKSMPSVSQNRAMLQYV